MNSKHSMGSKGYSTTSIWHLNCFRNLIRKGIQYNLVMKIILSFLLQTVYSICHKRPPFLDLYCCLVSRTEVCLLSDREPETKLPFRAKRYNHLLPTPDREPETTNAWFNMPKVNTGLTRKNLKLRWYYKFASLLYALKENQLC